jgi:transcriptional regulator with XRE-family HTH domain
VNDFFTWMNSELNLRGWTNAELARRMGLSRAAISLTLSGTNAVTWEFCAAVAEAFHMPAEEVFRRAGLLRPVARPEVVQEIVDVARNLPADDQILLRDFGQFLFSRKRE